MWSWNFIKKRLQSWNFIKKRLQHRFFPANIAKFFRTPVLQNICERLFERFPAGASNITRNMGIEEDIFSKPKQKKWNLAIWKNLHFHDALDHFVFLYISTACLRRRLPCIIKDNRSDGLNSLTIEGLILDQWKVTPLCCCCPFSTLLGFSASKCCIVEKQSFRGVLWKDVLGNFAKFKGKYLC